MYNLKKRANVGDILTYFIVALTVALLLFFAVKYILIIKENACKVEIQKFETELKNSGKEMKLGDIKEFIKTTPCNAEEVYFFDREGINEHLLKDSPKFLKSQPILKSSLKANVDDNIFIAKDDEIIESFSAGNFNLDYPDFICMLPRSNEINYFLEGVGKFKQDIFAGCLQPECTFIPVDPTDSEVIEILSEAVEFGSDNPALCPGCPSDVVYEWSNYTQTDANVKILRKFKYCKEQGVTNVEIVIKPNKGVSLKELRFYESIPKDCINDIQQYLVDYTQDIGEVYIKFDPLIIWKLGDLEKEQRISYTINRILSEECKEAIEGLGIAETVLGGVTVPFVPPPVLSFLNIPKVELPNPGVQIAIPDLNPFVNYIGPGTLTYSVFAETNPTQLDCSILGGIQLECDVILPGSSTDVTLEVTDGTFTDYQSFKVKSLFAGSICGNTFVESGEDCEGVVLLGDSCATEGFSGGTLGCYAPGTANECMFDTTGCFFCGDGNIDVPSEQCEGADLGGQDCASIGLTAGTLTCTGACQYDVSGCVGFPSCGDTFVTPPETCDLINLNGMNCVNQGFDGGIPLCYAPLTANECTFDASQCYQCGDGNIDPGEECDGLNFGLTNCLTKGYDGGPSLCFAPGTANECMFDTSQCFGCGDGNLDLGEQCDDGNLAPGDGCDASCQIEPCIDVDGDGYGNPSNPNCPSLQLDCNDNNVAVNPGAAEACGNGIDDDCFGGIDNGCSGICDTDNDGHAESGITFAWCSIFGDPLDDCDDDDANIFTGNNENGANCLDGKDNNCNTLIDDNCCGNNKKEGAEACDDGNIANFDGCSSACKLEYHADECEQIIYQDCIGIFSNCNNYCITT